MNIKNTIGNLTFNTLILGEDTEIPIETIAYIRVVYKRSTTLNYWAALLGLLSLWGTFNYNHTPYFLGCIVLALLFLSTSLFLRNYRYYIQIVYRISKQSFYPIKARDLYHAQTLVTEVKLSLQRVNQ